MTNDDKTAATLRHEQPALPIKTLQVSVVDGPDKGSVCVADSDTVSVGTARDNDLVLTDKTVSGYHLDLRRVQGGVNIVDNGSTNGTRLADAQLQRGIIPAGTLLTLGRTQIRVDDGENKTIPLFDGDLLHGLRGKTPIMRRLMNRIENVARSNESVLLVGESGTGKELIAEAIHTMSSRSDEPFVTVDCGSLSPTLVASELFGHEQGAFTGAARQRIGAFERAHGGTLFLDEIGELPSELQATLLGVLERRRFRRLGGQTDINVDIRIVGATHHDLRAEVNAGRFRLDLYYRLAVVGLQVPPLRERTADIPLLVDHFLREASHEGSVAELFPDTTMRALLEHRWPGNVRELRNVVAAALAMGEADTVGESLSMSASGKAEEIPDPIALVLDKPYKTARADLLSEFEARFGKHVLDKARGNVSRAAREAGMDRSHLSDLLRRHNLR